MHQSLPFGSVTHRFRPSGFGARNGPPVTPPYHQASHIAPGPKSRMAVLSNHCWVRHGEPPNVTVDKNGHGFLRNGELT